MNSPLTSKFISRLKSRDETAWFELWETFGPVLRGQLTRWGKGRVGPETVRDLSQETLAALSDSIDRYDPAKGARFSTWLLAIARHVLGDEIDRRAAQKRGGSGLSVGDGESIKLGKSMEFDESWMAGRAGGGNAAASSKTGMTADEHYEAAVFRAKVHAALRLAEKDSDFGDFEVYRMRVLEGRPGKEVADELGLSEPTVSRRLARVRVVVRDRLSEVMETYSFTPEEFAEMKAAGLKPDQGPQADATFDDAVGEIYRLANRERD
jgi:RNA polymerase sigma factor (sigma-70 family)